jgi:putative Mg2+ transporter-C (MgtC) family protein
MEGAVAILEFPTSDRVVVIAVRVLMAAILGGTLGFERELHRKAAGLRTHIVVAVGAAVFVMVALESGATSADLSRVIQGVATGIGFVGAGTILKPDDREEDVKGITTAAGIWLTAAVGMAVGTGHAWLSILVTALMIPIVWLARQIEHRFLQHPRPK